MGRFSRSFTRGFENLGMTLTSQNWSDITGNKSTSGTIVNERSALGLSAVYACVKVLSETIASLPLHVYQKKGTSKQMALDHALYEILHNEPNPEMTSYIWRETMTGHLALWGNAYCEIEYGEDWRPKAIWPLRPDRTWPMRDLNTGEIFYQTTLTDGTMVTLASWRVLHVPGFGFDGLVGYSPIRLQMETIGTAQATQEYGSRFYSNGARPSGILEHPKTLSEPAQVRLRDSFDSKYSGLGNSHRTMLLEEGMSYRQIGVPPNEAQYIESRKFSTEDVSRIFRVPLHMIGDLSRATFSNIEQQSIDFATSTIQPYCVKYEQEFRRKLFASKEKQKFYAKFDMDEMKRGDMKSRYDSYAIGRNNGFLSVNDVREFEDLNPVIGGDIYMVPVNLMPATESESFWKAKSQLKNTTDTTIPKT